MAKIEIFSKGKNELNEDCYGYNKTSFVVVDGATDKSGRFYNKKTGGEIISRLAVDVCLKSKLNGVKLVNQLNREVDKLYKKLGVDDYLEDPKIRFNCVFVLVRVANRKIIITYLGDLGFRVNGQVNYKEVFAIDGLTATARAEYIFKTGDIDGSRKYILPKIITQINKYQNNPKHKLGYGVVDGTKTPEKFIKVFELDKNDVKTIEIYTDGYFDVPKIVNISAWEKMQKKIDEEDPYKYKKYKSTKNKDDRTVMIIKFK